MRTVHKPENMDGVRYTFGEVHIILPEDMHITESFKSKSMPDLILICLFSKQNANHKGTELAQTGEPSMLLATIDTARIFVSSHATYVRSILTECVCVQAELPLLG
jgi:hypothetical protein